MPFVLTSNQEVNSNRFVVFTTEWKPLRWCITKFKSVV